ncbi:hypothetical protein [Gymnodinialimonas hymeniacidonis]|uniref:hypothetical protein n=1 Tax=Gymnodinialimonas hymeniacidonis TaxID=3126508 RepID=UPI0034C64824
MRVVLYCLALLLPALVHAQQTQTYTGGAHNVTVGAHAALTLDLIRNGDGTYGLAITFDHVNLFGDVVATGGPPLTDDGYIACAEGHECITFEGTIALDSRSGFDDGTTTSFAMSLDLDGHSNTAMGVYHIGPLPGFTFEQYGTITLATPVS